MRLLVTGGAGYIGSHMVKLLLAMGHEVQVIDNLSNGRKDAVPNSILHELDIRDRDRLDVFFEENSIDAVLHFAGRIEVGESIRRPDLYYSDNVCGSRVLLDAMHRAGIKEIIFSSTAAVYGEPETIPIPEDHPKSPTNPYGASKWMVERMLIDESCSRGLRAVSLRYFNAAGAATDGSLGECHNPETHLIPLACKTAKGARKVLTIFGSDYPTPDGTCIRDYIHVEDLCSAHLRALEYLDSGGETAVFNLGYGFGVSVEDIVKTVERVSGCRIPVEYGSARIGDPARLVADPTLAMTTLNWMPAHHDIEEIVGSAWNWEEKLA